MRPVTVIIASLMVAAASGQPIQGNRRAPPAEPDPLYHVEVILFEWIEGNRSEEDFFHGVDPRNEPLPTLLEPPRLELESVFDPDPLPREPASIGDAEPPAAEPPAAERLDRLDRLERLEPWAGSDAASITAGGAAGGAAALPDGFRVLEAEELELAAQRARLSRRPYRLLGHAGWVQAGVDSDRAVPVDLKRLGITNPTGTIQVYVGRFLHAAVDLDFHDGGGTFWSSSSPYGLATLEHAKRYPLEDEHDAFRTGDYVLIDHPLFNVLIRVTPAPEPEPEPEDEPGAAGGRGPTP